MANLAHMQDFLGRLSTFPDNDHIRPTNVVMILLIYINGVWRVVMNVERRKQGEDVWGFPSGIIKNGENAWKAAKRELFAKTNHKFNMEYWDRRDEVKFTLPTGTRVYANIYSPEFPWCMKGDPENAEVVFVEYPRLICVMKALESFHDTRLSCGKFDLEFKECMWRIGDAFKR
jgi:8-oxo-dGTP pyrophosphatase MutT (NUDIX family)